MKLVTFAKYFILDTYHRIKSGEHPFQEYGLDLFTGCQGSGKTVSLVERLEAYRTSYEGLFIATNFGYIYQDLALEKFEDIAELPALVRQLGYKGLVIGWDEIQNDFDSQTRTFPIAILRTITQQRKQAIKILATSQVFTRVAKPIREQTFNVVQCKTFAERWTFQKHYDAVEYEYYIAKANKDEKLAVKQKHNFVHTDTLRELYDSYAVIDNLNKYDDNMSLQARIEQGYLKNDKLLNIESS